MRKAKSCAILLLAVFLLLSMTVFFSSCKKEEKTETATTEEITKEEHSGFDFTPESKTIVVWEFSTDPETTTVVSFVREFPEYKIDNSTGVTPGFWPDKSNDLPSLAGAIVAGTQPDLFLCSTYSPIEAYYSNLFMPLDDFYTYDPTYNFETLDSKLLEPVTFNGKVYFAPKSITTNLIIWNKDKFENVGLDADKAPETWDELIAMNEKLTTYDEKGIVNGIGISENLRWFNEFNIAAFGNQYADKTGLNVSINNDYFKKTIEFLTSLTKAYGGKDKLPSGITPAITLGNESAFYLYSSLNNCDNFGIAPLPKFDTESEEFLPYKSINYYGIPREAKNPKGGWKYLKYLYTDAVYDDQVFWYSLDPKRYLPDYIAHKPTRDKIYNEFKPLISEEKWAIVEQRDEIVRKVNVPVYDIAESSNFMNYFRPELDKVSINKLGISEFLENAQRYCESVLKDFKTRKEDEGWKFNEDGTIIPPQDEEATGQRDRDLSETRS